MVELINKVMANFYSYQKLNSIQNRLWIKIEKEENKKLNYYK
jgi:hypothetical protein